MIAQVICTLVTFALTRPLALVTVQSSAGLPVCAATVTAYAESPGMAVAKVKDPFVPTLRLSAPLSCSTSPEEPVRPLTVPLMVYVKVVQVTWTSVTLAFAVQLP
jgi:hypothetical protein